DCIHLASCAERETLPTNPHLPADVFTCCLTTPIEMAVRFFILQNPLPSGITLDDANNIPGRVSERRTPIGELNWIFTAITDTIAWNSLPKPLFKRLFRQDLMVAALFRNFLLAQRIMRVYHCRPHSHPAIPDTHDHPLWRSWDLAVEMILAQLPDLLAAERGERHYDYQHSNFFAEQLTAFDVYLGQGAVEQKVPEQLPIVLQVLLSQVHRLRALVLLSKFLDLGPWAVNLALSIGIFPYVLKLLQSQAVELKPVMIFIWARILAVDQTCQTDLLKDNGYQYFVTILDPRAGMPVIANLAEHRAMCAFIIAMFCKDFRQGQNVCLLPELFESCITHLIDMSNPLLRQWSCLCLSMLWVNYPEAKWMGIRCSAYQRLCELVIDPIAEVRAAMLHALTSFLGIPDITPQVIQIEESIASNVLVIAADGNSMVRKELLVFFSTFIPRYENRFIVAAYEHMVEERNGLGSTERAADDEGVSAAQRPGLDDKGVSYNRVYSAIWTQVLSLTADPQPEVAQMALIIVLNLLNAALRSPLAAKMQPMMDSIEHASRTATNKASQAYPKEAHAMLQSSAPLTPPTPSKHPESYLQIGIKRTASVAQSLKNFAFGTATPSGPDTSPPSYKNYQRSTHNGAVGAPRGRIPSEWQRPPEAQDHLAASNAYHSYKIPTPHQFKPAAFIDVPSLPLKSTFYDWSVEYFREPQMKASEAEEPGSTDYNERLWRRTRNDKIIAKTQPLQQMAGSTPWNQAKGFFNNATQPFKMCFHQFEDHLIVSDDRDTVNVWDWKRQTRLNRFSNGNPAGSKITEIRLINEDDQAQLMTGSSDGIIRLFRNYESSRNIELVDAFRALTDLVPSNKNAGLVFDWQQSRGNILVAGDVRVIRVWNAGSEICGAVSGKSSA
ncbi:MAG: hypothetical protein INR71_04925, partial [Terriglobus roseus]|nr:hypothetical protein [Terriglobus roseus]